MSIDRLVDLTERAPQPAELYARLDLPEGPSDRPYVVMNMVATVDGKTLVQPRGRSASGLGSGTDRLLMRRIQDQVDAAIIGAATLRAGNVVYAPRLVRATFTRSGDLPLENRFFTDAPEKAIVFAPAALSDKKLSVLARAARVVTSGDTAVDPAEALACLRRDHGVRRCALEGGAALNWPFVAAGLVDEIFLTIAPKVKGGDALPTVVDGAGFPGSDFAALQLLSVYRESDELYLRYKLRP